MILKNDNKPFWVFLTKRKFPKHLKVLLLEGKPNARMIGEVLKKKKKKKKRKINCFLPHFLGKEELITLWQYRSRSNVSMKESI